MNVKPFEIRFFDLTSRVVSASDGQGVIQAAKSTVEFRIADLAGVPAVEAIEFRIFQAKDEERSDEDLGIRKSV